MQDRILRKRPDHVFREIAGEFVLVPLHRSADEVDSIFVMNRTGARIWELLDGSRTLLEVGSTLACEFGVHEDAALADVLEFAEKLLEAGAAEEV